MRYESLVVCGVTCGVASLVNAHGTAAAAVTWRMGPGYAYLLRWPVLTRRMVRAGSPSTSAPNAAASARVTARTPRLRLIREFENSRSTEPKNLNPLAAADSERMNGGCLEVTARVTPSAWSGESGTHAELFFLSAIQPLKFALADHHDRMAASLGGRDCGRLNEDSESKRDSERQDPGPRRRRMSLSELECRLGPGLGALAGTH
eukprot:541943-Rhodomonas_salina.2